MSTLTQPLDLYGRRSQIPSLPPEERDSLLSQVAGKALSGLGYVGSVLDKTFGGRAVRGLLGGRPEELLSILPFSDTLGITNEANRVSGQDLLKDAGFLEGEGEKGTFELRDLAGPLAEIGLDPATYLSFGASALSKSGLQAAKGIGAPLEKTLLGRIQAGQGGLAGLGLPFAEPSMVLGTGPVAQYAAGKLGDVAQTLKYGNVPFTNFSPGRALSGLFDPDVAGMYTKTGQEIGRAAAPGIKAGENAVRGETVGMARKLSEAGLLEPGNAMHTSDTLRSILEGTASPLPGTAQGRTIVDVVDELRSGLSAQATREQNIGIPLQAMEDYAPRAMTRLSKETPGYSGLGRQSPLSPIHPNLTGREEFFEGLPTAAINQMVRDTELGAQGALNPLGAAERVRDQYLLPLRGMTSQGFDNEILQLNALNPQARVNVNGISLPSPEFSRLQELNQLRKQSEGLADWLKKSVDPQYAQGGLDFFGNHILTDVANRGMRSARSMGRADVIHDALAQAANYTPQGAGPGARPISDVLKEAGLTGDIFDQVGGRRGAMATLQDRLGALGKQGTDFYVPADIARDVARTVQGMAKPEATEPFLQAFDSITNLTKAGQISIWPARYARDFIQGVTQNFVHNAYDPRYGPLRMRGWLTPYRDAQALLREGKTVAGAADIPAFHGLGLTDPEATKQLADLMYTHGVLGNNRLTQAASDVVGGAHAAQSEFKLLDMPQDSLGQILKSAVPGSLTEANPLNYRGVMGRTETEFAPGRAGEKVMEMTEELNRGAAFIAKMRQGYAPEQAAQVALRAQYDWGKLTGFEQSVMKRAVPFYCVPDDTEILTRDGWKTCDQVMPLEEVLTYNTESKEMEWQRCRKVNVFQHDQPIMVWESKRVTLRFTPDHRWFTKKRAVQTRHEYGTYRYPATYQMVPGSGLTREHLILVAAEGGFTSEESSLLTPEQARLVGWLVTDGYARKRGNCTEAIIYQHPKKFLRDVIEVAGGRPRSPHPYSGVVAVPVLQSRGKQIYHYIDKANLPAVVTRLSKKAAQAMYEAMYKADGCVSPNREYDFFAAQDHGVREAFRILAAMFGRRTKANSRGCSVYAPGRNLLAIKQGSFRMEHYKGRVWCPTTDNGTWVMRQNGFITITGNSWSRRNIPEQFSQLLEHPGGKVAQAVRTTNDIRGDVGDYVPEFVSDTLSIPIGKEDNGQQKFLTRLDLPHEDALRLLGSQPSAAILGQLNPLIKAPIELATGKQLYSGRDLADIQQRGLTGNSLADEVIGNSPLSRVASTVKNFEDTRRSLPENLLGLLAPAKITDVDMERSRQIESRRAIEEMLRGEPGVGSFQRLYVKPDDVSKLSPQEFRMYQLYQTMEREAQAKARAKKGGLQ